MKLFRSKLFYICLGLALVLVLIPSILTATGQTDLLRAAMGTVAKPFVWCFSKASDAVDGFVSVFTDYDRLKAENESLKTRLDALEGQEQDMAVLERENDWLRDYLNIHVENPQPLLTDATVISRAAGDHETVLFLNRGTAHGVKQGCAVMTAQGLLGYVSEVGLDWCKVSGLIETKTSVGAYADRTDVSGVVKGDATLREDGKCLMTYIDSADIDVGDRIYTSGEQGSNYPSGLYIGTVLSLGTDGQTGKLQAVIDPAVDFNALDSVHTVMILAPRGGAS
ncbi:MAG: rod shape-determining protein MreC [Clostridia bacterium]|nr:rod shape-determining protein MreC [Clostridia bacterium]